MEEKYKELRQEFESYKFRKNMKDTLGNVCVNCGTTENIKYHHIVPLKNGGTNKLSNIVPLCADCHYKAHDKSNFNYKNGGRPRLIEFEDAEPILKRYFNLEIGTKEAKQLLGISLKNKTTRFRLVHQYEEKYNIENFYNNIDLLNAQEQRMETLRRNKNIN